MTNPVKVTYYGELDENALLNDTTMIAHIKLTNHRLMALRLNVFVAFIRVGAFVTGLNFMVTTEPIDR